MAYTIVEDFVHKARLTAWGFEIPADSVIGK